MALKNTATGWGWLARLFHWSMAIVIIGLLCVGFFMANFVSDIYLQFELTQDHKSWGFVAFSLALLRVLWRLVNRAPDLPVEMSGLERLAAHVGHYGLYVCIVVMPLSGWLMSSASPLQDSYGIKNMVFGLFELPDPFIPGTEALESLFANIHFFTAITLVLLLLGHVAAALKHHFINRDRVLMRMLRG
ncbi:MAG: cytochrome b [Paracoccaceae bacterium]